MSNVPWDQSSKINEYEHPERLVSTTWLAEHLDDSDVVVVESDEDVLLYEVGHIPGALKIDWHTDLNDPKMRDYLSGEQFAELMDASGIARDTTVILYGDKNNWWAAYTLWVFTLFGHPDVRLLDGGRNTWIAEGRPLVTDATSAAQRATSYPTVVRDDESKRIFRDEVLERLGENLIDIRSPQEYSGERTSAPEYPEEGVLRGGHIPGAKNVPWARAVAEDGTFKSRVELEAIYVDEVGLNHADPVVTYCRIGERSSHTWFGLTYLLGFDNARNYDGSWTEWGNSVRVPIATGSEPHEAA